MKFLKYTLIFIFSLNLFSSELKELNPQYSLKASGGVTNIVLKNNLLLASTVAGTIDIFDIENQNLIKKIELEKIKDFTNKSINSKVYSTDIIDDKILILSQGQSGGRDIFIYENEKLENIISANDRLFIAYAKFIDSENIAYALLSNQIFIYNLKDKKITNEIQISQSSFSHFSFDEDKKYIFVADESGIITQIESKTLKKINTFKGQNVDRVFQIDIKKGNIITGGQDRRVALYSLSFKSPTYIANDFLIYSVALSPSSNFGAYALNEENDVAVFETSSKKISHILKNNKSLLTNILFLNENEIFVTSDDYNINYYNLKD